MAPDDKVTWLLPLADVVACSGCGWGAFHDDYDSPADCSGCVDLTVLHRSDSHQAGDDHSGRTGRVHLRKRGRSGSQAFAG